MPIPFSSKGERGSRAATARVSRRCVTSLPACGRRTTTLRSCADLPEESSYPLLSLRGLFLNLHPYNWMLHAVASVSFQTAGCYCSLYLRCCCTPVFVAHLLLSCECCSLNSSRPGLNLFSYSKGNPRIKVFYDM